MTTRIQKIISILLVTILTISTSPLNLLNTLRVNGNPTQTPRDVGDGGSSSGGNTGSTANGKYPVINTKEFPGYLYTIVKTETDETTLELKRETPIASGIVVAKNSSNGRDRLSKTKMLLLNDGGTYRYPSKLGILQLMKIQNDFRQYALTDLKLTDLGSGIIVKDILQSKILPQIKMSDSSFGITPEQAVESFLQEKGNNGTYKNDFHEFFYEILKARKFSYVGRDEENIYNQKVLDQLFTDGSIALHIEPIIIDDTSQVSYTASALAIHQLRGDLRNNANKNFNSLLNSANGGYIGAVPVVTDTFIRRAHLTAKGTTPGVNQVTRSIKSYKNDLSDLSPKVRAGSGSTANYKTSPLRLIDSAGIFILKRQYKPSKVSSELEVNVPATDFYLSEFRVVPAPDGNPIEFLKGQGKNGDDLARIKVKVKGGYNFKKFPWKETEGDLTGIGLQGSKPNEDIKGTRAVDLNMMGKTTRVKDMKTFDKKELKTILKPYSPSSPRLELQQSRNNYIARLNITPILNQSASQINNDKQSLIKRTSTPVRTIKPDTTFKKQLETLTKKLGYSASAFELAWNPAPLTRDFVAKDKRMIFEVFIKSTNQVNNGSASGIVSDKIPLSQVMDKMRISKLDGSEGELTPTGNKSKEDGIIVLEFDMNPTIRTELERSTGLVLQAQINWVDDKQQASHSYTGDPWKRTEAPLNHAQGGYGWSNNWKRLEIQLPKPNLVATTIKATHNLDDNTLCIDATGILDELPASFGKTLNTTQTINVYDSKGALLQTKTETVKGLKLKDTFSQKLCVPIANKGKDFTFEYIINKDKRFPKGESNFDDNIQIGNITVGQGEIDWIASKIDYEAPVRSTGKSYIYDISITGEGYLGRNDLSKNKISTYSKLDISEVGSNKTYGDLKQNNPKLSVGQKFRHTSDKTISVEVGINQTKFIEAKFTVNPDKDRPKKEQTFTNNVVTRVIQLDGPKPPELTIPTDSPDPVDPAYCLYDDTSGRPIDLYNLASFTVKMPREEVWGRKIPTYHQIASYRSSGGYACHPYEGGRDELGALSVPKNHKYYGDYYRRGDNIKDSLQSAPYDYSYSYFTYDDKGLRTLNTRVIPRYISNTTYHEHVYRYDEITGKPIMCSYAITTVSELDKDLDTSYTVFIDDVYTNSKDKSRTYSTEAQNTKNDKVFTAGKGIQTLVRTRVVTEWPYKMNWGGMFNYSVASGLNKHDQAPFATEGYKVSSSSRSAPKIEAVNYKETYSLRSKGYYTVDNENTFEYSSLPLRQYVFKLKKNELGIRERYTNVNYPEVVINSSTNYRGLSTNSIIFLDAVGTDTRKFKIVTDGAMSYKTNRGKITGGSGFASHKIGICYKDKLVPISNYYNDIYSEINIKG